MEEYNESDSAIHTSDSDPDVNVNKYGVPLFLKPKKWKSNGPTYTACPYSADSGITLAWKEVSVYVPLKNDRHEERHRHFKRVLNNVTGIVYPGNLMAVMGASGAGKTTLMNVLAHKAKADIEIGGEIVVNGKSVGPFVGNISGYVYQEDLFVAALTVAEHLNFMASVKLDRRLGRSERKRRVEELLVELSLKKCENTRIGIPAEQSGISGGERKRLAFATEIMTNPPLLFCDEPTTGLDSFSAKKIVGMLKNMACQGKTIICTIHQPSSQVFSMFDQFCLLAEGRTAFMGSSDETLNFMNKMNFNCPPHYNLGDFYIRTLSVLPGKEFESRMTIKQICDTFSRSKEAEDIDGKVQNEVSGYFRSSSSSISSSENGLHRQTPRPNWFYLTALLIRRSMINATRNPRLITIKLIQKICLALIIGICYLGIPKNQEGIQNVQGVIFLIICENTFSTLYATLHMFPMEYPLYLREHKAGLYRVSSYYLAKILSMIPAIILEGLIFSTLTYWLVGLRPNLEDYLLTCAVIVFVGNIAGATGCFFSIAFDSVGMAVACLVPLDYIIMVSGGQFMNLGTIPVLIAWAKYLSVFMYANEAISIIQWRNVSNITCAASNDGACVTTGNEVLSLRNFDERHLTFDFIGLVNLLALFHIGGYLALVTKSRRK